MFTMTLKNMLFALTIFGFLAPILPIQQLGSAITTQAHQLCEQNPEDIGLAREQSILEQSIDISDCADMVFAATFIGATVALAYYTLEDFYIR